MWGQKTVTCHSQRQDPQSWSLGISTISKWLGELPSFSEYHHQDSRWPEGLITKHRLYLVTKQRTQENRGWVPETKDNGTPQIRTRWHFHNTMRIHTQSSHSHYTLTLRRYLGDRTGEEGTGTALRTNSESLKMGLKGRENRESNFYCC